MVSAPENTIKYAGETRHKAAVLASFERGSTVADLLHERYPGMDWLTDAAADALKFLAELTRQDGRPDIISGYPLYDLTIHETEQSYRESGQGIGEDHALRIDGRVYLLETPADGGVSLVELLP